MSEHHFELVREFYSGQPDHATWRAYRVDSDNREILGGGSYDWTFGLIEEQMRTDVEAARKAQGAAEPRFVAEKANDLRIYGLDVCRVKDNKATSADKTIVWFSGPDREQKARDYAAWCNAEAAQPEPVKPSPRFAAWHRFDGTWVVTDTLSDINVVGLGPEVGAEPDRERIARKLADLLNAESSGTEGKP